MKVTVLEMIPEDPETILSWNNLVSRMERPEVFFTQQWALAASRAFSCGIRPLTFLIYESGELVGVAAMATNRRSPDAAFFLAASTADYCDVVSAPETRGAVLKLVFHELNKRNVRDLVFANVPLESNTLQAIRSAARSHGFHLNERPAYDCPVILLGDNEQRQTVLRSVLRKQQEKRGLNKLSRLGAIRVTHLTEEQLAVGLEAIFSAQISRFLVTNRFSSLISLQRRIFLIELGKLLSCVGWLKVSQLEVNGQPIAWNYGFRFHDSWFWYLPTFLVQYADSSPGSCLLRLLTDEACSDPSVKRLDLGLGDESYKARFCNANHSTRYLQLSISMPQHLANVGRYWMAASTRRFPAVDQRLRTGRDLVRRIRRRIDETGIIATAKHALSSAKRRLMFQDELVFFEAPRFEAPWMEAPESKSLSLRLLDWDFIAFAAIGSADDEQTLEYLARCAQRLAQGNSVGYFLPGKGIQPLHFLWVDAYDGFYLSEINSKLESGNPSAVMIFDCWTPAAQRGHGHYATAIRLAASQLQRQQKQPWIFSAARNESSVRGILRAGFVYRFSLVSSRKLGKTTLSRQVIAANCARHLG